jgi:tripartite-type tricarboxylate transporter receptor subunit TctC
MRADADLSETGSGRNLAPQFVEDAMRLPRRRFLHLAATAAALPATSRIARAQAYPARPIRLVIPFPPGGAFDAIGRPWAEKMKTLLGTIVVENIGGGGSSLGAAAVARAQPDGYTILLGGGGALVINPIASSRSPYDPIKDFEPISLLAIHTFALTVHPALPVRTLAELVDYARNNPGKLSYGSAGVGSLNHLTGELFKSLVGVPDIVHIPYRGAGPAMTDLISGHVPMIVPSMNGQLLEFHRAGKVRILAVTNPERLVGAPDLPTALEAGINGMVSQNLLGLLAPAGTPKPIVDQIAAATRACLADRSFQDQLVASGFELPPDSSPERMRRFVEGEIARWTPVIKAVGLKLD